MTQVIEGMELVYEKPQTMTDAYLHYCPGCGHSVAHRLLMEVVQEMGIQDRTVGVAPVGCSVFAYNYMNIDMQEAAHGRACAVATGVKRVMPDKFIFTYQGDGDLAAIGTAETVHTINRGENILIVFINNGVYGMTGGQMAPTTLIGMKTTTSPYGREQATMGYPLKITEMISVLPGAFYVTRQAVHTAAAVRKTKKAFEKAFEYQKLNRGTCFIEIVSNCPSGWKMTPVESNEWMEKNMFPLYPLGDIKVPTQLN
ncbi:MAG: 2-oxoglutarate oxidoreductase [Ignavibacteriales bacterium]|nr:2-oxoglutarate oxidoreductase [Ignavibacteriales bacterium]